MRRMENMHIENELAEPELRIAREGAVLVLTLNRPQRHNALSLPLYEALLAALEEAEHSAAVRAVVLTGEGRSFCAGGDVQRMAAGQAQIQDEAGQTAALRRRTGIVERLHAMPKPTIAMLRGHAIGAGLSLALACDLRYGDRSARLRTGFLPLGLPGDFGGHYFLPRIVGPAKARELYLLSPTLGADEALGLGLLNGVFEADELRDQVMARARELAGRSSFAIRHLKQNLMRGAMADLSQMLDDEAWRHVACTRSDEHRQAVQALKSQTKAESR